MATPLFTLAAAALLSVSLQSGRPPSGPVERYEPRVYDVEFGVALSMVRDAPPYWQEGSPGFNFQDAPIVMPVIFQSSYSAVDRASMSAQLWLDGREDTDLLKRVRVDDHQPFASHLAVLPVVKFNGQTLRWKLTYRTQVFSARINDAAAAKLTWPREWPEEVRDGLKPQLFIESDDPIFTQAVETVTQGKLRTVPPYLAAKELVRHCILNFQRQGSGNQRGEGGALRGMGINGARNLARTGLGTSHDLVCICVATLRAAGIPARAVVGIQDNERHIKEFVSWAEFYLEGAGWIPFDPDAMHGKAIRTLNIRDAWPEFGTLDDLNRRVPLAFTFIPPSTQAPEFPAVWGWDPRPGGNPGAQPTVMITVTSRGKGVDDPR